MIYQKMLHRKLSKSSAFANIVKIIKCFVWIALKTALKQRKSTNWHRMWALMLVIILKAGNVFPAKSATKTKILKMLKWCRSAQQSLHWNHLQHRKVCERKGIKGISAVKFQNIWMVRFKGSLSYLRPLKIHGVHKRPLKILDTCVLSFQKTFKL